MGSTEQTSPHNTGGWHSGEKTGITFQFREKEWTRNALREQRHQTESAPRYMLRGCQRHQAQGTQGGPAHPLPRTRPPRSPGMQALAPGHHHFACHTQWPFFFPLRNFEFLVISGEPHITSLVLGELGSL